MNKEGSIVFLYPIWIFVAFYILIQSELWSRSFPEDLFLEHQWEFGLKGIAVLIMLLTSYSLWSNVKPENYLNKILKGLLITVLYAIMFGITLDLSTFIFE